MCIHYMYIHYTVCILHAAHCTHHMYAAHRWTELLGITQDRKALLSGAAEVHLFIREADDTKDRMSDKVRCVGIDIHVCVYLAITLCMAYISLQIRTYTYTFM